MAVFRIERTRDYTVMSNHHLRNANLSLKAKGLLSMMLSLPEDWNYTTRGLAKICKEGVDAIGAALRELEAAGYIVRHKLRDRQGRISDTEYVIYEQPQPKNPDTPQPDMASPDTENPDMVKPDTEKPAELNIEKVERHNSLIWDWGFFYIQKSEGVRSMAVFRIERTRDYTVMSNHHLRNANLSLKAKGLLSMMLSLPEDWNYTTRGLAKICKEGVDAIGAALRELEAAGYIVRHKLRDRQGRISDTEYVIYEQPQLRKPDTDSPDTENPYMDKPDTEKPAELNIEKSNTQKQNIYGSSTDSIPFRDCAADCLPERKGRDAMSLTEIESYRELIQENIGYEYLCQQYETYREDLDEIVELIVETVCAKRKTTRIAGSDFPHEIVRSRFLKLDNSHIEFVMDCLQKNTTEIRNMKQYLLTVLFNAPTTISNHYISQVNHDLYGGW